MTSQPSDRPIEAVVLDVFGTIAQIGEKRRPYRQLLEHARTRGRRPSVDDAKVIMTRNCGLAGIPTGSAPTFRWTCYRRSSLNSTQNSRR